MYNETRGLLYILISQSKKKYKQ